MPEPRVPRISASKEEITKLPLSPTDGFILSSVDGVLSEADLSAATGLSEDVVSSSLEKLHALGAIRYFGEPDEERRSDRPTRPILITPEVAAQIHAATNPPAVPSAAVGDSPESEEVDLDHDHRQRIEKTYSRLSQMTYYQLLDVPSDADKKAIKKAYFELAAVYHPDRFFRKRLGKYKDKMQAIFVRVTNAHDVLTSKDRAEYDLRLARHLSGSSGQIQAAIPAHSPSHIMLKAVMPPAAIPPTRPNAAPEANASAPSSAPDSMPLKDARSPAMSAAPVTTPVTSIVPPVSGETVIRNSVPPMDRRDALARKLRGGVPGTNSRPPGAGPVDSLHHRYLSVKTEAMRVRAQRFIVAAEDALKRGDKATARREANSALELCPNDDTIHALIERIGQ